MLKCEAHNLQDELTKDSRARSTIRHVLLCGPDRQDSNVDQLLEMKPTTDGLVNHPLAAGPGARRGDTRRTRYGGGNEIGNRL